MKICLVGMAHISANPRLVREADALHEAGYDVRVVFPVFDARRIERDTDILRRRDWWGDPFVYLSAKRPLFSLYIRGRRRICQELYNHLKAKSLGLHAYVPGLPEMREFVTRHYADLYVAHTQRALPVAYFAAEHWRTSVGFDCEDLVAELDAGDPPEVVRRLESTYLSKCSYISTPSKVIADQLELTYHIKPPITLYNVFPSSLAKMMRAPNSRPFTDSLKLHWFSNTIGPNRGVETAVRVMGLLGARAELYLRGEISSDYRQHLKNLSEEVGGANRIHFLPLIPHDDLIHSMEQFDVGLALETGLNTNYSKTVTNKLFSYMLAGLAIAASDTRGQREILSRVPDVGILYPLDNPNALALKLRKWLEDRSALRQAQQASWDVARKRFCWDVEKQSLLNRVGDILARPNRMEESH